jgi:hypothetical protein
VTIPNVLQESLRLLWRLEPVHRPLAFPDQSTQFLGAVFQLLVVTVVGNWG